MPGTGLVLNEDEPGRAGHGPQVRWAHLCSGVLNQDPFTSQVTPTEQA